MAALLPQLPLLQAIPLHIDTVRNSLTETLNTKLAQTLRSGVTAPLTARHSRSTSSTDVPSSHNNLLPRKKRRLENDESESYAPLHRRPTTLTHSPRFRTPLTTVSPLAKSTNTKILEPDTPRRPLGDLLLPQQHQHLKTPLFSRHPSPKTFQGPVPGSRHITPSNTADAGQLPGIRRLHTSISELTRSSRSTLALKENVPSNRSCSPPAMHSRIQQNQGLQPSSVSPNPVFSGSFISPPIPTGRESRTISLQHQQPALGVNENLTHHSMAGRQDSLAPVQSLPSSRLQAQGAPPPLFRFPVPRNKEALDPDTSSKGPPLTTTTGKPMSIRDRRAQPSIVRIYLFSPPARATDLCYVFICSATRGKGSYL